MGGIRWPFPLTSTLPDYSSFEGLSAPAVWDATPQATRLQILIIIGFFEFWSESAYVLEQDGTAHYMKGGKPGYFPTFKEIPHPVPLNLFDPFGLMSLVSEAKVPGAVPALAGLIKRYDGQVMGPFSENDVSLGFVKEMLAFKLGI